jgi:hypothetical protein
VRGTKWYGACRVKGTTAIVMLPSGAITLTRNTRNSFKPVPFVACRASRRERNWKAKRDETRREEEHWASNDTYRDDALETRAFEKRFR